MKVLQKQHFELKLLSLRMFLFLMKTGCSTSGSGGGGGRVTHGEEVPGSIPVVAARSLLVGSVSV